MSQSLASVTLPEKKDASTFISKTASAGSLVVIRGAPERTLYVGGVPLWLARSPDALRSLVNSAASSPEGSSHGTDSEHVEFITQLPISPDHPSVRHFHITFMTPDSAKRAAERLYRSQIDGHTLAVFCLLRIPSTSSTSASTSSTTSSLSLDSSSSQPSTANSSSPTLSAAVGDNAESSSGPASETPSSAPTSCASSPAAETPPAGESSAAPPPPPPLPLPSPEGGSCTIC